MNTSTGAQVWPATLQGPAGVQTVFVWSAGVNPLFDANNTAANDCYQQFFKVHIRFNKVCRHSRGSTWPLYQLNSFAVEEITFHAKIKTQSCQNFSLSY